MQISYEMVSNAHVLADCVLLILLGISYANHYCVAACRSVRLVLESKTLAFYLLNMSVFIKQMTTVFYL